MNLIKSANLVFLIVFFATQCYVAAEIATTVRQDEFSLGRGHLAIKGFDPVSYHQVSGPVEGKKAITVEYRGIIYRFISSANKAAFLKDPDAYEPAYGGWCAWAMLDGERTQPHPESFRIVEGKLYLFYDGFFGDTLKSWKEKISKEPEAKLIEKANRHWASQIR